MFTTASRPTHCDTATRTEASTPSLPVYYHQATTKASRSIPPFINFIKVPPSRSTHSTQDQAKVITGPSATHHSRATDPSKPDPAFIHHCPSRSSMNHPSHPLTLLILSRCSFRATTQSTDTTTPHPTSIHHHTSPIPPLISPLSLLTLP